MKQLSFNKRFIKISLIIILSLIMLDLSTALILNKGYFTYSLDDAYIHLSIAENIAHGHYGINPNEFSAAASSIIWPVILAPFTYLPFAEIFPFLLNSLFAFLTVLLSGQTLLLAFKKIPESSNKLYFMLLLQLMLIFAFNLVGLVFTGMEHSLQVFLTVGIIYGLIKVVSGDKASWLLYVYIILVPLVRYENAVLSLLSLGFLFLKKDYLKSSLAFVLILASLGGFSAFLLSIGMSALPTSITAKSATIDAGSGFVLSIISNFMDNIRESRGTVLAILTIPLLPIILNKNYRWEKRLLAFIAVTSVFAHLFGGELLYWNRYYPYVVAIAILAAVYLYADRIFSVQEKFTLSTGKLSLVILLLISSSLMFPSHFVNFLENPIACNNIYQQQYQMHKFITNYYNKPVAVNDIGYPSWKNENHILDYAGLSYAESNLYFMKEESEIWMDKAAKKYNVEMVMIYDKWFPYLPKNWVKVGEFFFDGPNVVCGDKLVSIYAINNNEEEIEQLILKAKSEGIFGIDIIE